MQRQVQLPIQCAEHHAVAAVAPEKRLHLREMPGNVTIVADGNALCVPLVGETCPQAQQRAVRRPPHGRAVGHIAVAPAGAVMHQPRPFCFGRMEEQLRFADGAGKVIGEGHGADFAVADLHPLVRKDEIRFVVRADVKRPVKALPIGWGHAPVAVRHERPQRVVSGQNRRAAAEIFALEARQHVQLAMVFMHFGRPVVAIRPECAVVVETLEGAVPILQIAADVHIEAVRGAPAGCAARTVEVILPVPRQHKGVTDVDFFALHGLFFSFQDC